MNYRCVFALSIVLTLTACGGGSGGGAAPLDSDGSDSDALSGDSDAPIDEGLINNEPDTTNTLENG